MPILQMKNSGSLFSILVIAVFCVLALFIWQGNNGFNLWDEGFLWYGVQRVIRGEVPIRDFMAYDPGRYYWSAALMSLWGDSGIMALRGAAAIFQAAGLFFGLLLIAKALKKQDFLFLLLSAVTLLVWMFPRHKVFDHSLSMLSIAAVTFLVQSPTGLRYFFSGLCVGILAIFGRNHGVYGVAGSLVAMLWLSIKSAGGPRAIRGFALWVGGVVVGFTPILFMALFVPGFAAAFLDDVRFLFQIKGTNLLLPVPWPWLVNYSAVPLSEAIRGVIIGLFFIGIIAFGALSLAWVFWKKNRNERVAPALVAASCMALPYAHYAYSRADVGHLTHGIFPMLIGCLVVLEMQPAKIKWPLAAMLCAVSLWTTYVSHPGWYCQIKKKCVNVEVSGSYLQVDPGTASDIGVIRDLSKQFTPQGESFIATPLWPGAYALLERKSPMWEIYALFPHPKAFELAEIERIKVAKPGFAIVFDLALDGHDELRFRNTHPLIYQYILDNFVPLPRSPNPAYQFYRAKRRML